MSVQGGPKVHPRLPEDTPASVSRPEVSSRRDINGLVIALVALAVELLLLLGAPIVGLSLDLRGGFLLGLLLAIAVTADIAVALAWNRWPHPWRLPGRTAGLLVVTLVGTLVVLVFINRQQGFYTSFSDIWGASPQHAQTKRVPSDTTQARLDIMNPNWLPGAQAAARQGHGTMLAVRLWGLRSGLLRHGYVYLPAAYFTAGSDVRFPVIEFLHGQPGGPGNYLKQLGLWPLLDSQIAQRRMPPVIAVLPEETTHEVFDECVNAVHGQRNDTYLTTDVAADVNATFRTLGGRTWGIAGYSTGGFCAVNLASHHPDLYAVAASISGYFTAGEDPHTGRLYAGSKTARRANSPTWWVTHAAPVAPALYIFASAQDRTAAAELQHFQALVQAHAPLLPVQFDLASRGGHNWNVWRSALPDALRYMSNFLPMPLTG